MTWKIGMRGNLKAITRWHHLPHRKVQEKERNVKLYIVCAQIFYIFISELLDM